MRVLVCGSRDYADQAYLFGVLDKVAGILRVAVVIEGEAPGADTLARHWATMRGYGVERYPAAWDLYGKAAGPIRNQQMLVEGKPDLVVAFPLDPSRGTRHMMRIAQEAGVPVWEMPQDEARIDALGGGVFT